MTDKTPSSIFKTHVLNCFMKEWNKCEHTFDCHSSDPHCIKCGINRSEIE